MEMNEKHTHGKVEIHRISIKYVRICWLLFLLLRFFLFHSPFSLARSNGLRKKERERERSGPMSILTIISDWLSAIVNVCAFRCEGQMHTFLKISPSAAICTIPLALNILFFFWVVGMCCTLSFHRYTWIFSDIWNNINNGTRYVLIPRHTEERYMLILIRCLMWIIQHAHRINTIKQRHWQRYHYLHHYHHQRRRRQKKGKQTTRQKTLRRHKTKREKKQKYFNALWAWLPS